MGIGIVVDNDLNSDIRVLREIRILKEQGFEIFVLCFGFDKKIYHDPVDGITINRISIPRRLKNILFFFMNLLPVYEWLWAAEIKKSILKYELEYLHVHDLYMARAAHSGIKNSQKNIPLFLDLHENYPFTITTYNWTKGFPRKMLSRPDLWKKKEHEYLGYADRIVTLSNEFRDVLLVKYPDLNEDKFVVFPNVPDISSREYHTINKVSNPFQNSFPILFYYGVIAERRGVFDALEVFSMLIKENYPVNFLIIGPVDKKDKGMFAEMIIADEIKDYVHYISWINSSEFPGYLAISDICLAPFHKNPQHESGVANKIFDYMLGAKPVVASDCRPQQNLIEKHDCGLIFEDKQGMRAAIIRLLNDGPLRKQMGINGRKAVEEEYNSEIFRNNLLQLYKSPDKGPDIR